MCVCVRTCDCVYMCMCRWSSRPGRKLYGDSPFKCQDLNLFSEPLIERPWRMRAARKKAEAMIHTLIRPAVKEGG